MILIVDFQVHFWLLLSKRAHLKDPSTKEGTSEYFAMTHYTKVYDPSVLHINTNYGRSMKIV